MDSLVVICKDYSFLWRSSQWPLRNVQLLDCYKCFLPLLVRRDLKIPQALVILQTESVDGLSLVVHLSLPKKRV